MSTIKKITLFLCRQKRHPDATHMIPGCIDLRFSDLLDAYENPFVPSPEFYQELRKFCRVILKGDPRN